MSNKHLITRSLSVSADFHGGDPVAEETPFRLNDALSIRSYGRFTARFHDGFRKVGRSKEVLTHTPIIRKSVSIHRISRERVYSQGGWRTGAAQIRSSISTGILLLRVITS